MGQLVERTADFDCVLCALESHVATITLNRPERRNALNYRAYDQLEAAFRAASADPQVRAVIVTGADPAFCSGDDVAEWPGPSRFPPRRLRPNPSLRPPPWRRWNVASR